MKELGPLRALVEQLRRLPGIGAKGAQRLAFHILREPRDDIEALIDSIRAVKEQSRTVRCVTTLRMRTRATTARKRHATGRSFA